ncbi:MAG: molybdopterin-guanine dinucleotide biosynthesis protein B [Deltaproteobacteria bacterium]|jgi:molybdopterin-guanine dinucleotide biosynthesis adapter protein|nr:molybdopterin-guanine dinucleotide biosynthesis protein B [Deltaproteobacteria bacterium]MBT4525689.1 molybdopterin-guanine dinucleotide biosynthesis protein B [Deltaproteobacteria bacterium]
MTPKLLSVIGRSGSGKTQLITQIIPYFVSKNLKIGSIKHTHHQAQFDKKGKDSWKHKTAGSAQVLLMTDDQLAIYADIQEKKTLREIADYWFQGFDMVISEGFKKESGLKIEVCRQATQKTPLFTDPEFKVNMIVSDYQIQSTIPVFDINAISQICSWIETNLFL